MNAKHWSDNGFHVCVVFIFINEVNAAALHLHYYTVFSNIISNDFSANGDHSYLLWALCELQLASHGLKTVSKTLHILIQTLHWLLTQ